MAQINILSRLWGDLRLLMSRRDIDNSTKLSSARHIVDGMHMQDGQVGAKVPKMLFVGLSIRGPIAVVSVIEEFIGCISSMEDWENYMQATWDGIRTSNKGGRQACSDISACIRKGVQFNLSGF
ncbi:hypothetical protein TWF225_007002 [Orbilia oligospora]|uniref:Uncharacterized protein n=1 Tax=Orbilia oligospora TaxID=2813651 RepID=A0A7C8PLQ9_ORBOL|nr:hypothetical protein TWF751_006269 [Orbilia oligospora]KAF3194464.1 hypothetical protein TWF225_007002 [Orbilia oligospora]KAF3245456.1 hypothetical protein TWF128_009480 [Orbilia oligospora]KAF3251698.1 hypothetical protein TWF217_008026 [Orbilia oligospora]KAF3296467.1 hypothetical protein TWF132_010065 [Orbilia oligospora]